MDVEWIAGIATGLGTILGVIGKTATDHVKGARVERHELRDDRAKLNEEQRKRIVYLERSMDEIRIREDECQKKWAALAVQVAEMQGAMVLLQHRMEEKDKRIEELEKLSKHKEEEGGL